MKTIVAEYIWLDGQDNFRSKTKVMKADVDDSTVLRFNKPEYYPVWNYDGSSTAQASTDNSEVLLRPVAVYKDPMRDHPYSFLVLCENYVVIEGQETHYDMRRNAVEVFNKYTQSNCGSDPMFGLELEFFLYKGDNPLGMPYYPLSLPPPQANYYCGIGSKNAIGRNMIEKVLDRCLRCNLGITGLNAEVAPSQWEFQVCEVGIKACDDTMMFKYLLQRTAEEFGLDINFHPKPIEGDWNGSGCHVNFSTKEMREGTNDKTGYDIILESIEKLRLNHDEHMALYGVDNEKRLTGEHETGKFDEFSSGVADRGCSIRIPRTTHENQKGYFEDRRPSSNMNPYIVCAKIYETCCL